MSFAYFVALTALAAAQSLSPVVVTPTAETAPVTTADDAADDPAIWVHLIRPEESLIIGTNKKGGLAVYDLSGTQVQFLPGGEPNNVDLRTGFPWNEGETALVTAGDRSTNSIRAWRVDATTRLARVSIAPMDPAIEIYGSCMYRSPQTGKFYFIATAKDGLVQQWELLSDGGVIRPRPVRSFRLESQCEGCVADEATGSLYIAEEAHGVWKLAAEPEAPLRLTLVDEVREGGPLAADVEGLALYRPQSGPTYLIVSSQGNSSFAFYQADPPHSHVASITIGESEGIDAVSGTDGIECTTAPLGDAFPAGLFVAQDDENPGANQNFKLVSWRHIQEALDRLP